jgi:hypothetical protein
LLNTILWGLIVAAAAIICGIVYIKAQLCVKRENSNAKSPGNDFILIPIFSPESHVQITSVMSHFHIAVGEGHFTFEVFNAYWALGKHSRV